MLILFLMVLGLVLLILAGFRVPAPGNPPRWDLLAFGLACWLLAELLKGWPVLSH